jgi:hypothetical protein
MTLSRHAMRRDENHARLRLTWRHMGFSWVDLFPSEPGMPDALLGARKVDQLAEVKAPDEEPRKDQIEWHRKWRGRPVVILRTPKDLERLAKEMNCPTPSSPSAPCSVAPKTMPGGQRR